jgi:hypothetical protein
MPDLNGAMAMPPRCRRFNLLVDRLMRRLVNVVGFGRPEGDPTGLIPH